MTPELLVLPPLKASKEARQSDASLHRSDKEITGTPRPGENHSPVVLEVFTRSGP